MGESGNERLDRLVHDLRTPLTLVVGFTELLQRRGEGLTSDQRTEYIARLADAAQDLKRILDEERASGS